LLAEEDEEQDNPGCFLCMSIGAPLYVAGRQPMSFHFARVVKKLVDAITVRADADESQNSLWIRRVLQPDTTIPIVSSLKGKEQGRARRHRP
jgi:hypothetical protein